VGGGPGRCTAVDPGAHREDLIETLEGLEKGLTPTQQSATTAAIAAEVREALRKRKAEKKPRYFIRFLFGRPIAKDLDIPGLLKEPDVYKLHPEPDVAAAIMVVHRFAPLYRAVQLQGQGPKAGAGQSERARPVPIPRTSPPRGHHHGWPGVVHEPGGTGLPIPQGYPE